jgi:ribosomal protein S7
MKTESINWERAKKTTKKTNVKKKIVFPLINAMAGDHKGRPATKIVAITAAIIALKVKKKLISVAGFSAFGKKRMIAAPKPGTASVARRSMADIVADPQPTSFSV